MINENKNLILETSRLLLRKATTSDAPFMHDLLTEPSFIRFIRDHNIKNHLDAEKYIQEKMIQFYFADGLGPYIVELKIEQRPIGICGIYKREEEKDLDIGFALLEKYWFQGYATEAAAAVLEYGRKKLGFKKITGLTTKENLSSARVLTRIGLQFEKPIYVEDANKEMLLYTKKFD